MTAWLQDNRRYPALSSAGMRSDQDACTNRRGRLVTSSVAGLREERTYSAAAAEALIIAERSIPSAWKTRIPSRCSTHLEVQPRVLNEMETPLSLTQKRTGQPRPVEDVMKPRSSHRAYATIM